MPLAGSMPWLVFGGIRQAVAYNSVSAEIFAMVFTAQATLITWLISVRQFPYLGRPCGGSGVLLRAAGASAHSSAASHPMIPFGMRLVLTSKDDSENRRGHRGCRARRLRRRRRVKASDAPRLTGQETAASRTVAHRSVSAEKPRTKPAALDSDHGAGDRGLPGPGTAPRTSSVRASSREVGPG